jgi:hypothetical protein
MIGASHTLFAVQQIPMTDGNSGEGISPDDLPPGDGGSPAEPPPVSARVPPHVARGVFSTGVAVFTGPTEFVLDFVLRLGAPHQIVARVVVSPLVVGQFIAALRENLSMYTGRFGPPPSLPAIAHPIGGGQPGNAEDFYHELKLADELLSGVYANAVMIGHTPSEFWFDFITNFFPRSAVSCRVFMTAQQVPGLLDTLVTSFEAFQRRISGEGLEGPPPSE